MSQNNNPITDITAGAAITNFITGMVPAEVADIGAKKKIGESRESWVKYVTNQVSRSMNLALQYRKQDPEGPGYEENMRKARAWFEIPQFPPHSVGKVMNELWGRHRTLVESQDWNLGHRNVPADEADSAQERFEETEMLRRKRQQ
jgi:hypothetical protein